MKMKKLLLLTLGMVSYAYMAPIQASTTDPAASYDPNYATHKDWLEKIAPSVRTTAKKYNIYGSVEMAQTVLESGWGQSQLSLQANNFYGIKGSGDAGSVLAFTSEYNGNVNGDGSAWKYVEPKATKNIPVAVWGYSDAAYTKKITPGRTVLIKNGTSASVYATFAHYKSFASSLNYNGNLIRNGLSWDSKYYSGAWKENAATYQDAAKALQGKYATDPNYAASLIRLIDDYGMAEMTDGYNPVSGPYSYNKAVVYEKGNYTAWSNFRFSAKKAKLTVGKVYTAKYLYKHDNGSQYVSLYDGSTWVGYVNITGIAQQAVRSMKDVTVTKAYTLWQNLAFSSKKGVATVGKQYRAKYIYVHGNGHTYLSLYDLKTGAWVGYFDATGATTVNGGSVNATGPSTYNYTMLYEKPYTVWDNLNFGVKRSALSIGKAYTAKYTYQHTNGSSYVSLYDGSRWAGYVEIGGLTQSGVATDKIVTIKSAYTLWGDLAFNAIKGKATIGNQYRTKVIYVHGNGHTYYSLYDVKTGKWIGYFDATGLK